MAQSEESENLSPDENIFINPIDGLSNQHPTLPHLNSDNENEAVDADSFDELPTSVIVTNIHSEVFINDNLKTEMEDLFRTFSDKATFQWLRSFKRLRVNYDSAIAAANARIQLHQSQFNKSVINCYFAQPVTPVSHKNLQPPAPVKQFLISPPASPPAGWEPREENEPLVNHDLLAALANLTPGESHEVHPPTESQPAIIVHTAAQGQAVETTVLTPVSTDDNNESSKQQQQQQQQQRIIQTKCPERT